MLSSGLQLPQQTRKPAASGSCRKAHRHWAAALSVLRSNTSSNTGAAVMNDADSGISWV